MISALKETCSLGLETWKTQKTKMKNLKTQTISKNVVNCKVNSIDLCSLIWCTIWVKISGMGPEIFQNIISHLILKAHLCFRFTGQTIPRMSLGGRGQIDSFSLSNPPKLFSSIFLILLLRTIIVLNDTEKIAITILLNYTVKSFYTTLWNAKVTITNFMFW